MEALDWLEMTSTDKNFGFELSFNCSKFERWWSSGSTLMIWCWNSHYLLGHRIKLPEHPNLTYLPKFRPFIVICEQRLSRAFRACEQKYHVQCDSGTSRHKKTTFYGLLRKTSGSRRTKRQHFSSVHHLVIALKKKWWLLRRGCESDKSQSSAVVSWAFRPLSAHYFAKWSVFWGRIYL